MTADVSVIMPAYAAQDTIAEAAASALSGQSVSVELVICSDDGVDYRGFLRSAGLPVESVVHIYSEAPRSGCAAARNTALRAAGAPVIAALDADDAYVPGRLRVLLEAIQQSGLGAATGATWEGARGEPPSRIARAKGKATCLGLAEICGLRMPFSPVFDRTLAPQGWPPVSFAEDMLLNAHLWAAAGGYAFAEGAAYRYFIRPESLVQGPDSLERAIAGYEQILAWLPGSWIAPAAQAQIAQEIAADLVTAQDAVSRNAPDWRAAFRS